MSALDDRYGHDGHDEALLSSAQRHTLAHFESFYPRFDRAIVDEDTDRVATLVEERRQALVELLAAFARQRLPARVRTHIEGSEALVRVRLLHFYDRILFRLACERATSTLVRYQEQQP